MRITSKQLRQIIKEELARTIRLSEAKKRFTPTPEMLAMRDPVTGFMPHPREIAALKAKQAEQDLAQDITQALGPVGDFGAGEDEDQVAFDKVYGHTRGTLPDGRRLDPITEAMIIGEVEKASRDALLSGPDFPIYPNAYDILEAIDPSRLLRQIKKASTDPDPRVAQTASAWFKYLNENKADAEAILHKAIYETLKHAAAMGRIDMNAKKANLRWDAHEFYAIPSGEINETRRKRR
jgi:hypothetical protein